MAKQGPMLTSYLRRNPYTGGSTRLARPAYKDECTRASSFNGWWWSVCVVHRPQMRRSDNNCVVSVPSFRSSFARVPEISSLTTFTCWAISLAPSFILNRCLGWVLGWGWLSFMGTATGMGQKEERAAQVVLGNLVPEDIKRAKKWRLRNGDKRLER